MQATELVNELYMRLARQRSAQLSNRCHFYSFSAMLMRRILSDFSRRAPRKNVPGGPEDEFLCTRMAWIDAPAKRCYRSTRRWPS